MRLIDELTHRVREKARRLWMKHALRGVGQKDAHGKLERAYWVEDPWHMNTAREQFRFAETNRVITEHAPVSHLLEIGCGEGHQSEWLSRVAGQLTGLDVSPTAIHRARSRVPSAHFVAGDLYAQPWVQERGHFDVVTACEVLYYLRDIPRFLRTIDALGHTCVVTYFSAAARVCEAPLRAMPDAKWSKFAHEDTEWIAVVWPGAARRAVTAP